MLKYWFYFGKACCCRPQFFIRSFGEAPFCCWVKQNAQQRLYKCKEMVFRFDSCRGENAWLCIGFFLLYLSEVRVRLFPYNYDQSINAKSWNVYHVIWPKQLIEIKFHFDAALLRWLWWWEWVEYTCYVIEVCDWKRTCLILLLIVCLFCRNIKLTWNSHFWLTTMMTLFLLQGVNRNYG